MGLGVAVGGAARHANAAAAKPDRERSLVVVRRRRVSPPCVHAKLARVSLAHLTHRPLRDAEHGERQAGAAELDAGRSAAKSHQTERSGRALAQFSTCEHHKRTGWPRRVGVGAVH